MSSPSRAVAARTERVRAAAARRFGVDARALAAFRIAVGLVVLADLALRARHLDALYTDAGILPSAALADAYPALAAASLHAQVGGARAVAALFLIAGAAAIALTVGYRTRLATAASLALLLSLQARNPFVLNSGDLLLWQLLVFGLFLPLGARWSLDARRSRAPATAVADGASSVRVANLVTAAVLVHVALVYVSNLILKLRGDHWIRGDGAAMAFSMEQFTVFLGPWVAGSPGLLVAINYGWLATLAASPLLVLATGRLRTTAAAGLLGAHLGMLATLGIGVFPLVSATALLLFFPPTVWDRTSAVVEGVLERLSRTKNGVPSSDTTPAVGAPNGGSPAPSVIGRGAAVDRVGLALTAAAALLLVSSLLWNAAALGYVDVVGDDASVDPADHGWKMFAPDPSGYDRWFLLEAELETGDRVDALGRPAVSEEPPPEVAATYPSARWRKFLITAAVEDDPSVNEGMATYVCTRAERTHDARVERATITYVQQETWPARSPSTETIRLVDRTCSA